MAEVAADVISRPSQILKAIGEIILGIWQAWSQPLMPKTAAKKPIASQLLVAYTIVHTVPGRVRFRVPRLVADGKYAHKLQILAQSDACITGVRINRNAASVVFNYEPDMMLKLEQEMPKVSIPLASPKDIGVSYLVNLIQQAADNNAIKQTYEKGSWRDGEYFSDSPDSRQNLFQPIAQYIILACSLDVRKAEIPSSCCLLKSKTRKPLAGGAKSARIGKLRKLRVLI
jgi:hypothetical protein